MLARKMKDTNEGVGHTSRVAALMPSPVVGRRTLSVAKTSTLTTQTVTSSDEESEQISSVTDVGKYSVKSYHNVTYPIFRIRKNLQI